MSASSPRGDASCMSSPRSPNTGTRRVVVGNDVLDLADPRCLRIPLDGRFADRVLAGEERERIRSSTEPRRALWRTWAAKEAAYKVVSKLRGAPPPFVHSRFLVRENPTGSMIVTYGNVSVPVQEERSENPEALHVVAWYPAGWRVVEAAVGPLPDDPPPLRRLTQRERRAIHSPASGWVRLRARARAAALMSVPETDLEIVCEDGPTGRSAPNLLVGGRTAVWDVSLSHHGRWIGWALARGGGGSGSGGLRDGS